MFQWLNSRNIGIDLSTITEANQIVEQEGSIFTIEVLKNNVPREYEFRVTELKQKNKIVGFAYFVEDITEYNQIIKELEHLANYDFLTHVFNRRRFMEKAYQEAFIARKSNTSLSVLMVDIDFFKKVNDNFVHLAGDEVIKSIVLACKKVINDNDIIGRYGGEEFAILLPDDDLEKARIIAEQIRMEVEKMEIPYDGRNIKVTVSIVISEGKGNEHEEMDIYQLINKADMALYDAKKSGRNRVCYDEIILV